MRMPYKIEAGVVAVSMLLSAFVSPLSSSAKGRAIEQEMPLDGKIYEFSKNSSYEIDTERDLQLTFRCRENCAVFVRVTKAKDLRIRGFFDEGVHASVLFWNVSEDEVHFDESYEVMCDADVTVAYGECAKGNTQKDIHAVLRRLHPPRVGP